MSDYRRSVRLAPALLLAGCAAVGPDYRSPPPTAATRYTQNDPVRAYAGAAEAGQTIKPGTALPPSWWQLFKSPALDATVALALAGSPTLATARANLAQARDAVNAARGSRLPQIGISASAGRGEHGAGVLNSSGIGANLSYDTDAFGAAARRIEQAQALADVQQAQWRASELALASNVVTRAIELASAIEQMRAAQDIIAADQRSLELVRISQAAGKSAGLDVLTAESQAASDRALLPQLQQQASAARHALAVLAGRESADWVAPDFDFASLTLPGELPLSLPSALIRRRPDIQAAEAQLRAANANIGIATAQLYPSIVLGASWTAASVGGALFAHPSHTWDLAADLLAPVFNGGTLRSQRDAAVHAYAAQLGTYRQTVLTAFAQVADVLAALENDAALLEAQRKALDVVQATLELTQQSYQAGQTSLPQIIEAQRLYQQARLGYVRAKAQRYLDTLQLLVAMGGAPVP